MKLCETGCGRPATSQRHHYCDACRRARKRHADRERARLRDQRTQRGYGADHRRRRRQLQPLVDAGLATCARCGRPIAAGADWDLGHDDHDRSRYTGPEHTACNRATAGRRPRRRQSRVW